MDRYHLRVQEHSLQVLLPCGAHKIVPLHVALATKTLKVCVQYCQENAEGAAQCFPVGLLESWLACVADSEQRDPAAPPVGHYAGIPTEILLQYLEACDYFADEARLQSLCSTLVHRLLSPPDEHDTLLSSNEMLDRLSEGVAHRVLRCTPPDRLDHALAVLAKAWHPEIVRTCLPSISSHSTLSLDCSCEQHPQATLVRVLQALCSMPPLHSLALLRVSLRKNRAPPTPLRHALQQAYKAPEKVSVEFNYEHFPDPVLAECIAALKENTALKSLAISKKGSTCPAPIFFLAGVEAMTGLESLTLSGCRDSLHVALDASLASLTNLTALRFTCVTFLTPAVHVLLALQNLRELAILGQMPDHSEAAFAIEREGETPSGVVQTAIMHAASRLPLLSHFEFGHDFGPKMHFGFGRWGGDALGKLSQFSALCRCKLDSISLCGEIGEVPAHVAALAQALQNMPRLETLQLYVFVTEVTTGLLPVLDALEVAGTSHSCTALSVEHESSIEQDLSQVCVRLARLTQLQELVIGCYDVMGCTHPRILKDVATALRNLTLMEFEYGHDPCEEAHQADEIAIPSALFLQAVAAEVTKLQTLRMMDMSIVIDSEEKVYDALATLLPRNVDLRELSFHISMNAACCAALAHLTALTMLYWTVADDTGDEVHLGQENAPQAYTEFSRALGHLTSLESCTVTFQALPGGVEQLCASLSSLRRLKNLRIEFPRSELQHNQIIDWDRLLQALAGPAALESLELLNCPGLSDEAASAAARSLSSLTNLRTLTVHTGPRSIAAYEGLVSIAHTLSKLPKLAHLDIDIHPLAMEEKQGVKEILQSSPSLKKWLERMRWQYNPDDRDDDGILVPFE